jgi:RNA polymerase sigma-70 factor (ECF subfamily)
VSERAPSSVLDEYLIVQSQLGDEGAFARLVRRWHPRLLRHAYHFTRDPEAARDVAQESWMAVVRGLGTLRDPAAFRPWALRIVANKGRDWVRREQARRKAVRRAAEDAPREAGAPAGAGGVAGPGASEAVLRVRAGLAGLEPDQRLVLTLYYVEEMRVREIAEVLSVPTGTVKSRLFNARRALERRLEEV